MDEEQVKGQETQDVQKETSGSGTPETAGVSKSKVVQEAKAATAAMKVENDRRIELLKKEEERELELEARKLIGGDSEAGKPSQNKEETPKEYKDRVMKGEV